MFVILPRTSYPILTFLNRPDKARAGFTDNVRLGQVSDIQEDERIIFRATMNRVDESSLYWRGITLDYFDGTSWRSTRRGFYTPARTRGPVGTMINQTIYLEPYDNSSLFALDKPLHVELRRARKNDDLTFTMPGFIDRRIRYTALSALSDVIPEERITVSTHLQLPPDLSPRIVSLAKSLAVRGDRNRTVKRVLDHLSSDRYGYSLKDLPVSKNPLETFLFDSPRGNCEYFASAMAVLLRVNDIPSRLVGGYHGGYYNEMGGYYLVPQKNAHVWVEAHIPGKGWVRFDPTPAGAALSSLSGREALLRFRMFLDTINYYWYGIVLTYNLERQISITRTIVSGLKRPSSFSFSPFMKKTAQYLALLAAALGLVLLAWFLMTSMKPGELAALDRFLKRLKAAGYEKNASEGLEEFLQRIGDDDLRTVCLEFAREFEKIYYRDRRFTADDLRRLNHLTGRINDVEKQTKDRMAGLTPGQ
jgi:transglutaminase-like putative cysteine protease